LILLFSASLSRTAAHHTSVRCARSTLPKEHHVAVDAGCSSHAFKQMPCMYKNAYSSLMITNIADEM